MLNTLTKPICYIGLPWVTLCNTEYLPYVPGEGELRRYLEKCHARSKSTAQPLRGKSRRSRDVHIMHATQNCPIRCVPALGGSISCNKHYVLRPSMSAKPSCAPEAQGIGQGHSARSCVAAPPRFAVNQGEGHATPTPRLQAVQGIPPPCTAIASVFCSISVKAKPCGRCAALTEQAPVKARSSH